MKTNIRFVDVYSNLVVTYGNNTRRYELDSIPKTVQQFISKAVSTDVKTDNETIKRYQIIEK